MWQVTRFILQKLFIGRLFARIAGGRHLTIKDRHESCRNAALVYHKLHQLHLTGMPSQSGCWLSVFYFVYRWLEAMSWHFCFHVTGHTSNNACIGTTLALGAVNLAEVSGVVSDQIMAEIYLNTALRIRASFPTCLQFLTVCDIYFIPSDCFKKVIQYNSDDPNNFWTKN